MQDAPVEELYRKRFIQALLDSPVFNGREKMKQIFQKLAEHPDRQLSQTELIELFATVKDPDNQLNAARHAVGRLRNLLESAERSEAFAGLEYWARIERKAYQLKFFARDRMNIEEHAA